MNTVPPFSAWLRMRPTSAKTGQALGDAHDGQFLFVIQPLALHLDGATQGNRQALGHTLADDDGRGIGQNLGQSGRPAAP